MHGWNLELQCSPHGLTIIAEMHGILFCYDTYDSWNPRTKFRAAMLSLRTYDSWNARCSFFCSIISDSWNARIKSRAATLSARTYVSCNARCFLFCYNTLVAEMHSVPFVTPHMTKSDSWNTRTKSRAAMLSLRTYDSWNAQCSFVTSPMITAMHWWNLELQCFLYGHTIAEMHDGPFDTTHH